MSRFASTNSVQSAHDSMSNWDEGVFESLLNLPLFQRAVEEARTS